MLSRVSKTNWDVILIGAGMGGGMCARRLAERGLRVLIIEKGPVGHDREQQNISPVISDPVARTARGAWPKPMQARINGEESQFFAPVGSGVGGSSVFYAGALERPERHDLETTPDMPHPTGGWAVDYDQFLPYFAQAEDLLHISGTHDPLSSEPNGNLLEPPVLPAPEATMMQQMADGGLHPYRLHLSTRNVPGCQMCVGHKCPKSCKMDGKTAGILPAVATGRATLLTECTVVRLDYDASKVTGVVVSDGDQEHRVSAQTVVLAAGAFGSPRLLMMSDIPNTQGCANTSGWVGRGLMFHINELFAVWPRRGHKFAGASKSISLRDLYTHKGARLGMVQSMGLEADFGNISYFLASLYDRSFLKRFKRLRYLLNIPAVIAAEILGNAKIFVGIIEDLPYENNRVLLDKTDTDVLSFTYDIPAELYNRRKVFRKQIKKAFSRHRTLLLGQSLQLNFGHACGTLRFGHDPKTSVLNADCRAHDLDNLYVTDASFFPTSMGANPSLMIAANALRVADIIATTHHSESTAHV